jgi:hypothetical protein
MKNLKYFAFAAGIPMLLVMCGDPETELKNAQKANTIEAYKSFFDNNKGEQWIQKMAVDELTNQSVLAMVVVEFDEPELQKAAFRKISDQSALATIVLKGKGEEIIDSAWFKLTNQEILKQLADTVKAAGIRIRAVSKINDDNFLLNRCRFDISDAVRKAAVEQIKSDDILTRVAITSYYDELRYYAKEKVKNAVYYNDQPDIIDQQRELSNKIDAADANFEQKLDKINNETDQDNLAELAINSDFDVLCLEAVKQVVNQQALTYIILQSTDRNVVKIAFAKLSDWGALKEVAEKAPDDAIKIAASLKLKFKTLDEVFSEALKNGKSSKELGDVLAALALLPDQDEINTQVTEACLTLIKRGDESRIPELVELLVSYGDIALTEDYLNCGQPDLYTAGEQWANRHGYDIGSGYGSNRARWGSGN